jgi:hypothetical protein
LYQRFVLEFVRPTNPLALLKAAAQGVNIKTATVLTLDTALATGGIHNIPFVVRANATPNAGGGVLDRGTGRPDPQGNAQFMLQ